MAVNLAAKYSNKVDERFYEASHIGPALNNDYKFSGVQTVVVYSIPTVDLNNYDRTGTGTNTAFHRYGVPSNLQNEKQELTITRDRSFSYTIDKADKLQTQMVMDAGKSLSRELREKVIPEYDKYCLHALAKAAQAVSQTDATAITKDNAYEMFLTAQETLSDESVPEVGRVCFCSHRFANLLCKEDNGFIRSGDLSQRRLISGEIGTVDGVRIIKIPKTWMPKKTTTGSGATTTYGDFILTHPTAATAPKQIEDYRIHDNPPGISGWLVEGRVLYDCFVLNNKRKAIFFHGPASLGNWSDS